MIQVGATLEEKVFYLDRAMLKAYADASGDQNPIHQNEEFAKAVGLPNVIAHGMLTMALVGKCKIFCRSCIHTCLRKSGY